MSVVTARRRLSLAALAALLAACGGEAMPPDDTGLDGGLDAAFDARPSDAPTTDDVARRDGGSDVVRVLPTTADRLTVMEVSWNPASVAVGAVAAVAESGSTRAFFGSLGVKVLASGALVGGDASVVAWRAAAAVPSGVAAVGDAGAGPMWMLGVDGMGRVQRVRNDYALEVVGDRYGIGTSPVRALGHAGGPWVGFWTDTSIVATNGVTAMRYMEGPFSAFAAGAQRFAGATTTRVEVLDPATNRLRAFAVPGVSALALTQTGALVFAVGAALWSERDDGTVDAFFRAPSTVRAMAASGARVWFVAGTELGTVVNGRVALTQGLALPADARIQAGAGDTLWVFRGAAAPKLYRAMEVMLTPEQQWVETVQPVFARRCGTGMCHGPPPMGRQTNLSMFSAWVSNCREIRARTVDWRAGSASALMPLGGPALAGDERAAVDMWTRARCPP